MGKIVLCVIIRVSVFNFLNMNINPLRPKYKIFTLVFIIFLMPFVQRSCSRDLTHTQGFPLIFSDTNSILINVLFAILLSIILFLISRTALYKKNTNLRIGMLLSSIYVYLAFILAQSAFWTKFFSEAFERFFYDAVSIISLVGVVGFYFLNGFLVYFNNSRQLFGGSPMDLERAMFAGAIICYLCFGFLISLFIRSTISYINKKRSKPKNIQPDETTRTFDKKFNKLLIPLFVILILIGLARLFF